MAERRYYRVAGLDFSISAERELFAVLDNYEPFWCQTTSPPDPSPKERGGTDRGRGCPLFDLAISPSTFNLQHSTVGYQLLYTDISGEDMPRIEVYRKKAESSSSESEPDDRSWLFLIAQRKASPVCASLIVSSDFTNAILSGSRNQPSNCNLQPLTFSHLRFAVDTAVMLLYAFRASAHGILLVHASAVVQDNGAYLFLGSSGTGKSTHARLWQQAYPDAWLLNDDNPVLRMMPDGRLLVYGSPWSGKTPCYRQEEVPVKGIALLKQADKNRIYPLSLPRAYAVLRSSCSGLKFDPSQADALHNVISQVIQTVPVYCLECLPDTAAAHLCHDTLRK